MLLVYKVRKNPWNSPEDQELRTLFITAFFPSLLLTQLGDWVVDTGPEG